MEAARAAVSVPPFSSRHVTVVVIEHSSQALPLLDSARSSNRPLHRNDQTVAESLVIALAMIMRHKFAEVRMKNVLKARREVH